MFRSLDLGAAELYVDFLIRLELLAGFIFARVWNTCMQPLFI